ncbi:hypothetical protein KKF84_07185 [Myxococcota bacterium]|nr:hypothetical protein [Myxococcota bacterium]MBU1535086.1 hypothetical protein [Myxococcota bacterium]
MKWNEVLYERCKVGETNLNADSGKEELIEMVLDLEQRVDKLVLTNLALWEILKGSMGITEELLLSKIREIDLRDGKLDGKISRELLHCPMCGRVMSKKHAQCLYCGHEKLDTTVYDNLT